MSVEKVTAKKQAEAWKTLVSVLPTILSAENSKDHVKSNFGEIKQACNEFGQTPDAVFGRLKRMSSEIVRQAKHEKVQSDGDANEVDGSSSDDRPLEFTKQAVKPKKHQRCKFEICIQCKEKCIVDENDESGLCGKCHEEGADNQAREPSEQKSVDDEEVPSIRNPTHKAINEEASSGHVATCKKKSIPAKVVKKSTPSDTTTKKRDRKTAKCMDCQAPVYPRSKRCMDCHKISLKAKSGDAKAKKNKVEKDQVKPASSGKLKVTLKHSKVDIGRKSNESPKKRRMIYN